MKLARPARSDSGNRTSAKGKEKDIGYEEL